jgi:hypothetical protein
VNPLQFRLALLARPQIRGSINGHWAKFRPEALEKRKLMRRRQPACRKQQQTASNQT